MAPTSPRQARRPARHHQQGDRQRHHDGPRHRQPQRRDSGWPEVAETATRRVAIRSSHRPATSPSGIASTITASDLPATIATNRRPLMRSSASIRSSGRSSVASAAAPSSTAHAPSTMATSADAVRINSVTTESGSVAKRGLPCRHGGRLRSRRTRTCRVIRQALLVRGAVGGEPQLVRGPAPGCSRSSAGCSVSMSAMANRPPTPGKRVGNRNRAEGERSRCSSRRRRSRRALPCSRGVDDGVDRLLLPGTRRCNQDGHAEQGPGDLDGRLSLCTDDRRVGGAKPIERQRDGGEPPPARDVVTLFSTTSTGRASAVVFPSPT